MSLVYLRMIIAAALILIVNQASAACVWKVTSGTNVLYLGGSIHALKSQDYPLPAAYNRAFDASDRLVCEVDPKALLQSSKGILKAGQYPKGDSLKNHVDPRTYNYLQRVFRLLKGSRSYIRALSALVSFAHASGSRIARNVRDAGCRRISDPTCTRQF
jgi:uncharacterized protein YbaP (TraB family)